MDGRRRRWFAADGWFPHGATAQRIYQQFGRDGLLVWHLFLCACKRGIPEGTFSYTCEEAGFAQLGLGNPQDRPQFTLEAFFKFTGRIKQTRSTRSGQVKDVCSTNWQQWQSTRKRATSGDELPATDSDSDSDKDILRAEDRPEKDLTVLPLAAPNGALQVLGTDRIESYQRLLDRVGKGDGGTPRVLQGLCKKLPSERIDEVAERYASRRVPAGVLVNTLKAEVRAYEAGIG